MYASAITIHVAFKLGWLPRNLHSQSIQLIQDAPDFNSSLQALLRAGFLTSTQVTELGKKLALVEHGYDVLGALYEKGVLTEPTARKLYLLHVDRIVQENAPIEQILKEASIDGTAATTARAIADATEDEAWQQDAEDDDGREDAHAPAPPRAPQDGPVSPDDLEVPGGGESMLGMGLPELPPQPAPAAAPPPPADGRQAASARRGLGKVTRMLQRALGYLRFKRP